jgi:hypothetical protein
LEIEDEYVANSYSYGFQYNLIVNYIEHVVGERERTKGLQGNESYPSLKPNRGANIFIFAINVLKRLMKSNNDVGSSNFINAV